jgi:Flp pilus assembly protein TadD
LIFARRALDLGRLEEAARLIRRAMSLEPESAEAWSLMGALSDRLGESHSAYRCFRTAMELDPYDTLARAGLRRYCKRFHLDLRNPAAQWYSTASLNLGPPR